MSLTKIADPASIARQGKLLAAMEASAGFWQDRADAERSYGHPQHALQCERIAFRCARIATQTRQRLVRESGLTVADCDEEHNSCPLGDCPTWDRPKPAPVVERDHQIVDRPDRGYRIHLFPPKQSRRPRWLALLLGWLP